MVRDLKSRKIIELAQAICDVFGDKFDESHFIQAIICDADNPAYEIIIESGASQELIGSHHLIERLQDSKFKKPTRFSPELIRMEKEIRSYAENRIIGTRSILKYVASHESASKLLEDFGVSMDRLFLKLSEKIQHKNGENERTPLLDKFTIDFTEEAKLGRLDPVVGRDRETEHLVNTLCRRIKRNAILVGDPGVGKTACVEGLAQRIHEGRVPETLKDKRVVSLDVAALVAGTRYRGDFEERIKEIIWDIISANNIILFIDEIHSIVGAGDSSRGTDAANILKPYLSRGKIQVIGATTTKEEREIFSKDGALDRRFQRIYVEESTETETLSILRGIKRKYEDFHSVVISEEVIETIVSLSGRYIHTRCFPDKAIDILDQSCSARKTVPISKDNEILKREKKASQLKKKIDIFMSKKDVISAAEHMHDLKTLADELEIRRARNFIANQGIIIKKEDVINVVASLTGIPIPQLGSDEITKLKELKPTLLKSIIGQDEAIDGVCKAITRSRVGIRKKNQPFGSFLFIGPTGTGKTETAKKIAKVLMGSEKALKRFDMSEFSEKHSISRLIGSPPGYVGYEEGGSLVETVRNNPYCVLLFDEIEKAHPDIYDVFLQILDEGKLKDMSNRVANFENVLIIMTSNFSSNDNNIMKNFGFKDANSDELEKNRKSYIDRELRKFFRPEFIGRIGSIVIYNGLKKETLSKIFDLQFEEICTDISERISKLHLEKDVKEHIIEKALKEGPNARALRMTLREIEDLACEYIIDNNTSQSDELSFFLNEKKIEVKKVTT